MIEKGDAQVVDGTVVLCGSLEPGQQRPPIPRSASGQDSSRRNTMRLDQLSQKSGGQLSQQNLLEQQPPEDEPEGDY